MTALLTIGAFGRMSGLSIKALRLYDESGLLPPTWIDPESGYRYYAPGQLERASADRDAVAVHPGRLRPL